MTAVVFDVLPGSGPSQIPGLSIYQEEPNEIFKLVLFLIEMSVVQGSLD